MRSRGDGNEGRLVDSNVGTPRAAAPKVRGKIYRRADVLAMMIKEPKRYQQLAPTLDRARREGRVR